MFMRNGFLLKMGVVNATLPISVYYLCEHCDI